MEPTPELKIALKDWRSACRVEKTCNEKLKVHLAQVVAVTAERDAAVLARNQARDLLDRIMGEYVESEVLGNLAGGGNKGPV